MDRSHRFHRPFYQLRRHVAQEVRHLNSLADATLGAGPTLVERVPLPTYTSPGSGSGSGSSSSKCDKDNKSAMCERPTNDSATLPIVLGVVIPVAVALLVCFYLHRKHKKKLRLEDMNDKHASLDFGMGDAPRRIKNKKGGKQVPEVTEFEDEKTARRPRGMSMDLGGSPYLMPGQLHDSRDSLHSMSRSFRDKHDPYRPVNLLSPEKKPPGMFPVVKRERPQSSIYPRSSSEIQTNLTRNAQGMGQSFTPRVDSLKSHGQSTISSPEDGLPAIQFPEPAKFSPAEKPCPPLPDQSPPPVDSPHQSPPKAVTSPVLARALSTQTASTGLAEFDSVDLLSDPLPKANPFSPTSDHGFVFAASPEPEPSLYPESLRIRPPPSTRKPPGNDARKNVQKIDTNEENRPKQTPPQRKGGAVEAESHHSDGFGTVKVAGLGVVYESEHDHQHTQMIRPLPPEDPSDSPEQRANRIRSFYREYFDDSKPGPNGKPDDFWGDYVPEYLNDGAIFDPLTGEFVVARAPYADAVGRRAMTPPPRGPPRMSPGSHGRISANSDGRFGPRAALAPSHRRPMPKKLPPPSPLRTLPTPHLLQDDIVFVNPIEFAPPTTFRDRQAGRPDSPAGASRPYSPMVPVHNPLVSSYDDLNVMPSPHQLRKSGTFTGLDFAPPPRFRDNGTMSDAGSIRSNRSGLSATQANAIRAGAYRISRIPKEMVGTKADINEALKPTWNMRAP